MYIKHIEGSIFDGLTLFAILEGEIPCHSLGNVLPSPAHTSHPQVSNACISIYTGWETGPQRAKSSASANRINPLENISSIVLLS